MRYIKYFFQNATLTTYIICILLLIMITVFVTWKITSKTIYKAWDTSIVGRNYKARGSEYDDNNRVAQEYHLSQLKFRYAELGMWLTLYKKYKNRLVSINIQGWETEKRKIGEVATHTVVYKYVDDNNEVVTKERKFKIMSDINIQFDESEET